jgi:uncharacterized protein (TIGR02117 family)
MKNSLIFLFYGFWSLSFGAFGQTRNSANDKVRIYIHGGGIHSDVIVPINHSTMNWMHLLEMPTSKVVHGELKWLSFGWGSRDFYLNTPRWIDVKVRDLVSAVVGTGGAAYHVIRLKEPATGAYCVALDLSVEEYHSLCSFILSFFESENNLKPMIALKPDRPCDVFYAAKGFYNALNNCNTWTNGALRSCGQSDRIWAFSYRHIFDALK